jgi:cytochrome b561
MAGMPAAGYLATNFSESGVKCFRLFALPPWGFEDKQIHRLFNGTHKVLTVVLTPPIAIHVLTALEHAAIDRDGIVGRMGFARSSAA